ncbi:hypothetical protein Trydic_g4266 [Trypoxylus dichotomus]
MSDNQYGFRRDHSTVDAIERLAEFVRNKIEKIETESSAVILLDISAIIEEPTLSVSSQVVRVCPQGSRQEPGYWNILYDSIFELDLGIGCEIIAFADDTTLLVRARRKSSIGAEQINKRLTRKREIATGDQYRVKVDASVCRTEGSERADELAKEAAAGVDDGAQLVYTLASERRVKSASAIESQHEWQENGIALSHQATQLVIGRGNFGAYLHRIGQRNNANCECGAEDTVGHVSFDCPYTEPWRARTETAGINASFRWPRNETEISHNETAEWWIFFSGAAEKLDRLRRSVAIPLLGTFTTEGPDIATRRAEHAIQSRTPELQTLSGYRRIAPASSASVKTAESKRDSTNIIGLCGYSAIVFAQMSVYHWLGNEIIYKSNKITEACYLSNWYELDVTSQKSIILLMERAKRPLAVTLYKLVVVSLTSLGVVVQWSYSVFAIIKAGYS